MGKKVIVSIISENNLPNIALIRNIMADSYLDIITEKSKNEFYDGYINAVTNEKTSYITDRFQNIFVDESNPEDIINKLLSKAILFDEAETIYINVTGGTKLLSLYTYIFFKEHYSNKSNFYYMNISSSSNTFIELNTKNQIEMKSVISLKQYLLSYNYIIVNKTNKHFSYDTAKIILTEFTGHKYKSIRSVLNNLLEILNKKYLGNKTIEEKELYNSFNIKNIIDKIQSKFGDQQKYRNTINSIVNNNDNICQFIDNIAGRVNNTEFRHSYNMNIRTLIYIISGFLEEYIYYTIKNEIFMHSSQENMIDENLTQSLRLKNISKNKKNNYIPELDVLFYYNNKLCYIECKSGASPDLINDSTLKQKAISSTLGISAYNAFVILNDFLSNKEKDKLNNLKNKAKNFKIDIISKNDLLDGTFISGIKKYCNII